MSYSVWVKGSKLAEFSGVFDAYRFAKEFIRYTGREPDSVTVLNSEGEKVLLKVFNHEV